MNIATCILMTENIVVAIFASIILREPLSKYDFLSSVISFAGIVIINNPFVSVQDQDLQKAHDYWIGSLYAGSTLFAGGFIALAMRYMRDGIHHTLSPFWFSSGCCFLTPFMFIATSKSPTEENRVQVGAEYDSTTILLITLISIFSFLHQNFISRAYQLERVAVIAPISYLGFVIALIFDVFIDHVKLSSTDILGSAVIVITLFLITMLKSFGIIY